MIQVKVDQLFFWNNAFVVLLKGLNDERSLPIWIGASEAHAIALYMHNIKLQRPLTHDLIRNLLDFLECHLRRIHIAELKDNTFYARLILERDGEECEMDSRPSDAIALALRYDAPIMVSEKIMAQAGKIFVDTGEVTTPEEAEASRKRMHEEKIEHKIEDREKPSHPAAKVADVLFRRMEQAIKDERYEDAAKIRDQIKRLHGSHHAKN